MSGSQIGIERWNARRSDGWEEERPIPSLLGRSSTAGSATSPSSSECIRPLTGARASQVLRSHRIAVVDVMARRLLRCASDRRTARAGSDARAPRTARRRSMRCKTAPGSPASFAPRLGRRGGRVSATSASPDRHRCSGPRLQAIDLRSGAFRGPRHTPIRHSLLRSRSRGKSASAMVAAAWAREGVDRRPHVLHSGGDPACSGGRVRLTSHQLVG